MSDSVLLNDGTSYVLLNDSSSHVLLNAHVATTTIFGKAPRRKKDPIRLPLSANIFLSGLLITTISRRLKFKTPTKTITEKSLALTSRLSIPLQESIKASGSMKKISTYKLSSKAPIITNIKESFFVKGKKDFSRFLMMLKQFVDVD